MAPREEEVFVFVGVRSGAPINSVEACDIIHVSCRWYWHGDENLTKLEGHIHYLGGYPREKAGSGRATHMAGTGRTCTFDRINMCLRACCDLAQLGSFCAFCGEYLDKCPALVKRRAGGGGAAD